MRREDFVFVDTAINGAYNRNNVQRKDEFAPARDSVDCFATFLKFTDDLKTYTAENLNTRGNPSVSGYPGLALATFLPFDFDDERDVKRAFVDAARCVRRWLDEYEIPANAIRVFFSGNKGVSVEIPGTLFGGFEPSVDIAVRQKRVALVMAEDLATVDLTIYEKLRLWRWPNSRHGKSKLYKIPLTVGELFAADLEEIRELARKPRQMEWPPDGDWEVCPELAALWAETAVPRGADRKVVAAVDGDIPSGARNYTLTSLAASAGEILPP